MREAEFYGRANLGVVTINLPDVALSAKDEDDFWKILDERLELCYLVHKKRIDRFDTTKAKCAPLLWCYGGYSRLDPDDTLHDIIREKHFTISQGYAGLYECVKVMTGESHTSPKGKIFGMRVMQALNDKCDAWKKKVPGIDFSLYGSPIEALTYKIAKKLKKRFGIVEGITDRDYITNSYHVPVFEEIGPFDKIEKEAEFQRLSPGG